ncbi:unnamed protein product [Protopolystoma xenopodis]|uniref:ETS domain-containing protein n=1 Tax=Protopolystoma xenopodis TaxID=117903 RepID=A0A448WS50_9PLAT|nr:unnamed protein product [Protopolystoma xenopodis]
MFLPSSLPALGIEDVDRLLSSGTSLYNEDVHLDLGSYSSPAASLSDEADSSSFPSSPFHTTHFTCEPATGLTTGSSAKEAEQGEQEEEQEGEEEGEEEEAKDEKRLFQVEQTKVPIPVGHLKSLQPTQASRSDAVRTAEEQQREGRFTNHDRPTKPDSVALDAQDSEDTLTGSEAEKCQREEQERQIRLRSRRLQLRRRTKHRKVSRIRGFREPPISACIASSSRPGVGLASSASSDPDTSDSEEAGDLDEEEASSSSDDQASDSDSLYSPFVTCQVTGRRAVADASWRRRLPTTRTRLQLVLEPFSEVSPPTPTPSTGSSQAQTVQRAKPVNDLQPWWPRSLPAFPQAAPGRDDASEAEIDAGLELDTIASSSEEAGASRKPGTGTPSRDELAESGDVGSAGAGDRRFRIGAAMPGDLSQLATAESTSQLGCQWHRRRRRQRKQLELWQFILHRLDTASAFSAFQWVNRTAGVFRITDTRAAAYEWGKYRANSRMDYEKMARAMR